MRKKKALSGEKVETVEMRVPKAIEIPVGEWVRFYNAFKAYQELGKLLCNKYGIKPNHCTKCNQPLPIGFLPSR